MIVNFPERDFSKWFQSFHGTRRERTSWKDGHKKRINIPQKDVDKCAMSGYPAILRPFESIGGASMEERREALSEHVQNYWLHPIEEFSHFEREGLPQLMGSQGYIVTEIKKQEGWG